MDQRQVTYWFGLRTDEIVSISFPCCIPFETQLFRTNLMRVCTENSWAPMWESANIAPSPNSNGTKARVRRLCVVSASPCYGWKEKNHEWGYNAIHVHTWTWGFRSPDRVVRKQKVLDAEHAVQRRQCTNQVPRHRYSEKHPRGILCEDHINHAKLASCSSLSLINESFVSLVCLSLTS
jgi:hypothetical protein